MKTVREVKLDVRARLDRWLEQAEKAMASLEPHEATINSIVERFGASLIDESVGEGICIVLYTNDLKGKTADLIETIERELKIECESSFDDTGRWGASRSFRFTELPIRVHVSITEPKGAENNGCRQIQVGTKTVEVPIYKIECADGGDA